MSLSYPVSSRNSAFSRTQRKPAALRPVPRVVLERQRLGPSGRFFLALRQILPTQLARVIALEGALSPQRLEAALRTLQARHPLMRVRLQTEGAPAFEHGAGRGLQVQLVARESETHWQRVLEQVLGTRLGSEPGPLFAAHYVHAEGSPRAELILVADHAVADGVSMNNLCAELLALCGGADPLPARPRQPILEQLTPAFSLWARASTFGLSLARLGRVALLRRLEGTRRPALGSAFTCHTLTEPQTAALIARARSERTTVTGALLAASLLAIEAEQQSGARLAVTVPVDLRPRLRQHALTAQDLGHYTSVVVLAARARGDAWPLARALKKQLEQAVSERSLLAGVALTYRTGKLFLRRQKPPLAHAMVSNSGIVPFAADYGAFRAAGFYSATSAPLLSADFAFFCNTLHGRLSINLVFSERGVTRAQAERALAHVVDTLSQP